MAVLHNRPSKVAFEEESTFQTAPSDWDTDLYTGDAHQFYTVGRPTLDGLQQATVENENSVCRPLEKHPLILGLKSEASFGFTVHMHGNPETAADAAQAKTFHLSKLCKNVMGGELKSYRHAVSSAASATQVTLDSVADLHEGMWMWFSGSFEGAPAQVTGISGTTITVRPALPSTPTSDDVAYATIANYLDSDALTDHTDTDYTTLSFVYKGDDDEDSAELRGVKLGMSIAAFEAGAPAQMSFEGAVSDFDNPPSTVPALTGSTSGSAPVAVSTADGYKLYWGNKSSSLSAIEPFSVEPKINVGHNMVRSPMATQGVSHFNVADAGGQDIGMDMTVILSESYAADFENQQEKSVLIQLGNEIGKAFAIFYPRLEISSDPVRGESEDRAATVVNTMALEDDLTTAATGSALEAIRSKATIIWSA